MFEYVFKDISEADYVIKHMKDVIELYGYVTVSDFYDLVGITVDKTDNNQITEDNVFLVWSCKTLQNNKALVSTTIPDGQYYEITYNGDKQETYIDVYKKWENFVVK